MEELEGCESSGHDLALVFMNSLWPWLPMAVVAENLH